MILPKLVSNLVEWYRWKNKIKIVNKEYHETWFINDRGLLTARNFYEIMHSSGMKRQIHINHRYCMNSPKTVFNFNKKKYRNYSISKKYEYSNGVDLGDCSFIEEDPTTGAIIRLFMKYMEG